MKRIDKRKEDQSIETHWVQHKSERGKVSVSMKQKDDTLKETIKTPSTMANKWTNPTKPANKHIKVNDKGMPVFGQQWGI